MTKAAAIVLAAGLGTRMGGRKMEMTWKTRPLPVWPVRAAVEAGCGPVVAVVGPGHDALDGPLVAAGARLVLNDQPEQGMASSIRRGLALVQDADCLFVLLGDMPLVTAAHLTRLLDALVAPATIAVPIFQGRRGNPVLFHHSRFAELAALSGDKGARSLLTGEGIVPVEMDDRAVLADIDTPEDLVELKA